MVALFANYRTTAGENRARSSTFCKHAEEVALSVAKWTTGPQAVRPLGRDPELEFEVIGTTAESTAFSVDHGKKWLGDLDSNQDSQIQNLESYRWTISHPLRQKTSRGTSLETNSNDSTHLI